MESLRDLIRHEAWADGKLLEAVQGCSGAWEDSVIREKLQHAHSVQAAYLALLRDEPLDFEKLELPFSSLDELRASVEGYHRSALVLLDGLRAEDLERTVVFKAPGFEERRNTVRDALIQVTTHSHYHRAQLATRIREFGGEPPLTDYIVWVWEGRPGPAGVE